MKKYFTAKDQTIYKADEPKSPNDLEINDAQEKEINHYKSLGYRVSINASTKEIVASDLIYFSEESQSIQTENISNDAVLVSKTEAEEILSYLTMGCYVSINIKTRKIEAQGYAEIDADLKKATYKKYWSVSKQQIQISGFGTLSDDAVEVDDALEREILELYTANHVSINAETKEITATPIVIERKLDDVYAQVKRHLQSERDALDQAILAQYNKSEPEIWQLQLDESKAYLADNSTETPVINTILKSQSLSDEQIAAAKETFANRIIQKAGEYTSYASFMSGIRQKYNALVEAAYAAKDVEALDALVTQQSAEVAYVLGGGAN